MGAKMTLVLAGGLLALAAVWAGPEGVAGATASAERWWRGAAGEWTSEACDRDPVGCLKAAEGKLVSTQGGIETALDTLRPAGERLTILIRDQEQRLASNQLLLKEARSVVQHAQDGKPLRFVGVDYPDKDALMRNARLLFLEGQGIERFLDKARAQEVAIRGRHDALLSARGEVRAALAMVPAQIELARANGVLAQAGVTVKGIDATVEVGRQRADGVEALTRTTDELLHDRNREQPSGGEPKADTSAFDAFMAGHE